MVFWEGYVSDEVMGTFAPIVVYWLYAGLFQLLPPLDNYRLHTRKEEDVKNAVPLRSVVKGVLLMSCFCKGQALQFNWLFEKGAFVLLPDQTFSVDFDKIEDAVESLSREILTIQAKGDKDATQKLLEKYGQMTHPLTIALEKLTKVQMHICNDTHSNSISDLSIVPYSQEYSAYLAKAAELLRKAGDLTSSPSLKRMLHSKADAFLSNDYYDSDIAWMELDSKLDVTIGPYETYEDVLFGYKATFEAFIVVRDDKATTQLKLFGDQLQVLEQNLPMDDMYKSKDVISAPIRVIHSQHHRLVVPYAIGSLYNHPLEGLLLDTVGGAISFLISGMTARTAVIFFCFATVKTVDDHCGLWLPGNLFHMFFQNNTAYHDVHHQLHGLKYNFSQPFFPIWDKLLGTYMPYDLVK